MKDIQSIPVFDDFAIFKKLLSIRGNKGKDNKQEYNPYYYDSLTIHFYNHYIVNWGFDFIENEIARVNDGKLKDELENYLQYAKNYRAEAISMFEDFLETISVSPRYLHEIKSFVPFNRTIEIEKVMKKYSDTSKMEEISAILVAYYFADLWDEDVEVSWYFFMRHFCTFYGNKDGQAHALRVFKQANEYLESYGADNLIPYDDYEFPNRLSEGLDLNNFKQTYNFYLSETQINKYEHVHIGKQTFYKKYMQLFPLYADLRTVHGAEFFSSFMLNEESEQAKKIKLFEYTFDNYYASEHERFQDYLSMIDCEFLYEKLASYVPVSSYSIESFINNNYCISRGGIFEKYLGILITYWLYDEEDISFSTSLYIHSVIKTYLENAEKHFENRNLVYTTNANEVIGEANYYGKVLNLPLIPCAPRNSQTFAESGQETLPWKYVQFKDNYVLLHHPNHYMKGNEVSYSKSDYAPFRLNMINSKKSYNEIKLYFENVVPMLRIRCKKGKITSVDQDSIVNLDNYVSSILYRTSRAKIKIEIKPREDKPSKYRTYTKLEASSLAQMSKSHYLEELCKMQLLAYKVYHFTETRANVSSFASEDIFCFVLKEAYSYLVIAIENTLDSRSTILFYIKKDELPRALDVINVFFASNTLNKRQSLQWKAVDFNDSSIIRYERIIHTSFGEWKGILNQLIYR